MAKIDEAANTQDAPLVKTALPTAAEAFRAELEALLAKYPTVRLNVLTNYTINIEEVVPKQPEAGTQTAPKD